MVFYRGPNVVTNGLVLNLDAANTKIYVSGSTTWNDLSGNNNSGSLTNGPTFNSANGGSIVFNGSNTIITNFPTQISGNGSKTISCFFKTLTTSRMGLCGTRDTSASTGWVLDVNRTTAGNLTYYHTGGTIIEIAAGINANTWYNATVTYNLSSTTVTLYLNGAQIGSPNNGFSSITTSTFNGVIGAEQQADISTVFSGSIASTQIYNRALTAAEISQNFNAQKSRFNL